MPGNSQPCAVKYVCSLSLRSFRSLCAAGSFDRFFGCFCSLSRSVSAESELESELIDCSILLCGRFVYLSLSDKKNSGAQACCRINHNGRKILHTDVFFLPSSSLHHPFISLHHYWFLLSSYIEREIEKFSIALRSGLIARTTKSSSF